MRHRHPHIIAGSEADEHCVRESFVAKLNWLGVSGAEMIQIGKVFVPILAAMTVGAYLGTEARSHPAEDRKRTHIAVWVGWSGFEYDAFQAVVNDYNKQQNTIFVDLLSISGNSLKTLISASAGLPPEISLLSASEIPQFADAGAIEILDEICKENGLTEDKYVPGYWDVMQYQGHSYALPATPATIALHYNTDILKSAGYTKAPETIEEMTEMENKITTIKEGKMVMAGFLPTEPGWWTWAWGPFFGGKLWDGKSKITFNDPENLRAMEWYGSYSKRFGHQQLTAYKSGFGVFASPENGFLAGRVAMEVQGVWMSNFIKTYSPTLKWDAVPFPYPKDRPDLKGHTIVDQDIFVLLKGCKHRSEAIKFLAYCESQPAMEKLCLGQKKCSPLRNKTDEFWAKQENPRIRLFDEMAYSKNAFANPKIAIMPQYQAEISNALDEVALRTLTPKEAVDKVTARMQPKLENYLRVLEARRKAGK